MSDWKALYPFDSHYLEIPKAETSAERVRLHYVQQGDPAAQQTILCVHGNPTWSFTYRRVLNELSDRARVVAVDHIGCGLSDKPQQYAYTLEQHIGNLARLIEQLDLRRVTLLVHDWGGAIGLGAALKVPARIEQFVILNTAAFPPPYVPWRIAACRWPWIGEWGVRRLNLFARAALTMTLNRLPRLEPAVAAGLLAPYHDWDSRIAIARFVQDIPRRKSQATWQTLSKIEEGLAIFADRPVRMVWGMKDWCFRPECLDRLEQIFPQAHTTRLADVGHYVMEEAADEVIAELRQAAERHRNTMNAPLPFPFDRRWAVGQAVELACLLEASAAKIGNVHPAASFSDMNFSHFLASATAIAPIFQLPMWHDAPRRESIPSHDAPRRETSLITVGQLVLDSVIATRHVVDCNTNLGMLLLFAPIAKAHLLRPTPVATLQQSILQVLQQLGPSDSQQIYLAIRHAAPGGLGKQAQADVADTAPADLVAAMAKVAHIDAVARQYTNGFADIFQRLVPWLQAELVQTAQTLEAVCRVQLRWLAYQPDGLIARKAGPEMAAQVQQRAASIKEECLANPAPLAQQPPMIEFDQFLRGDGHRRNPGTTADLIAAALLVQLLR